MDKDITGLEFVRSRMDIINKFEELKRLGLRSQNPIDDAKLADKSVQLLQRRSKLIESLQKAKLDINGCVNFEVPDSDVTEGSTISVKVADLEGYKHNAKIISDSQAELKLIDASILQLDGLGAGYFKDVLRDTETSKQKIKSIEQELAKLVRMNVDDAKSQRKQQERALKEAEAECKAKLGILEEQKLLYAEVGF